MSLRTLLALVLLLASSTPVYAQADCKAAFFATIGRTEGQPAPDWKAVLESLPGRGFGVNPGPGQIQPVNAPHHGMTVMIDAGGNARGRIWLAADVAQVDHNGNRWFTAERQVIAELDGQMFWAWQELGGFPRPCANTSTPPPPSTQPPAPVTPPPSLEPVLAAIQALAEKVEALSERLAQAGETGREQMDLIKAEILEFRTRPFPCFGGRLGGAVPVTLCPKQ